MTRRRALLLLSIIAIYGCPSGKVFTIGAVLPLTGDYQIYGQPIRKGIELAFEQLQGADFPAGLELEVADSGSDPDKAQRELKRLYGDGATAVIGGVTTAEAMKMVSVADEFNRVLLSPSASSPELTGISNNFYRVFPSDFLEGTKMGNFARTRLELRTVVILASEGAYAVGVQRVFESEFERQGGEVLDLIEFPEGTRDFSGLLDRVMTLKPSGVYLAAYANEVAQMVQGLKRLGFEGAILTTSAFAASDALARLGHDAAGVFLTQAVFDPGADDPAVKSFVEAFRRKYGTEPDLYAAHGYDAMMVVAEVIRDGLRTPSDMWMELRGLRNYKGVTGDIQFDEKGDVQKFPRVYRIGPNGSVQNYEQELEQQRTKLLERLRQLEEEQRRATQRP